jgi:hypothetical protein
VEFYSFEQIETAFIMGAIAGLLLGVLGTWFLKKS